MINKIISAIALTSVIVLGVYSYFQDLKTEKRIESFMNVWPRFTAQDGQLLCERVMRLEIALSESIGLKIIPCNYLKK